MHIPGMTTPAERLRRAREIAPYLTASEAARAMGMVVSTYINHEGGEREFFEHMPKYARFFRVNLEWLMTGRGPMKGNKIEQLISGLPPDLEGEAVRYLEFLRSKAGL